MESQLILFYQNLWASIKCETNNSAPNQIIMDSNVDDNSEDARNTDKCLVVNNIPTSSGFYDADKCRAYIANKIKVSKIDRFAAQISKAHEVESTISYRLKDILNTFVKRTSKHAYDFTAKCKTGLQRYRLESLSNNHSRTSTKLKLVITKDKIDNRLTSRTIRQKLYPISQELLHGSGLRLMRSLLSSGRTATVKHDQDLLFRSTFVDDEDEIPTNSVNECNSPTDSDFLSCESFEPAQHVKTIQDLIKNNLRTSETISVQLNAIRQIFEKLALEHRNQVDLVYSLEEGRQADIVVRRSAYNLSKAAFKATSTPVHVKPNNEVWIRDLKPNSSSLDKQR